LTRACTLCNLSAGAGRAQQLLLLLLLLVVVVVVVVTWEVVHLPQQLP
jgi:hypothetical protein